jgi:hypothetical protein
MIKDKETQGKTVMFTFEINDFQFQIQLKPSHAVRATFLLQEELTKSSKLIDQNLKSKIQDLEVKKDTLSEEEIKDLESLNEEFRADFTGKLMPMLAKKGKLEDIFELMIANDTLQNQANGKKINELNGAGEMELMTDAVLACFNLIEIFKREEKKK